MYRFLQLFIESFQFFGSGMIFYDFSDRFGLDLTDSFPCNAEFLSHFFQSFGYSVVQTEPETDHLFLTGSQCA